MIVTVGVYLLAGTTGGQGLGGHLRQAFQNPRHPGGRVGLLLRGLEIKLPPVLGLPVKIGLDLHPARSLHTSAPSSPIPSVVPSKRSPGPFVVIEAAGCPGVDLGAGEGHGRRT